MIAKTHNRHLRSVPDSPVEYWESLYERAESKDDASVDRFMRQKFGGEIVAITCRELFAFENDGNLYPVAIDHDGSVAAIYLGVERVTPRIVPPTSNPVVKLDVIDSREIPLAVFSTSHGPLAADITDEQYERMLRNDNGVLASCFGRIGLMLDSPVMFGPLSDREEEDQELSPPLLRVVE